MEHNHRPGPLKEAFYGLAGWALLAICVWSGFNGHYGLSAISLCGAALCGASMPQTSQVYMMRRLADHSPAPTTTRLDVSDVLPEPVTTPAAAIAYLRGRGWVVVDVGLHTYLVLAPGDSEPRQMMSDELFFLARGLYLEEVKTLV